MKTWFLAIMACILGSFLLVACNEEVETPTNETPAVVATGHPSIAALTQKIQESPQSADLYAARAGIYYENEGYDEAIQDLQMALRLDSMNVDYQHALADVYMDYYRAKEALKTMERAAFMYPERIPTLLKLSEFYLILEKQDLALKTLEQIRALDPINSEMFYMAGLVFNDLGKPDEAISNFQSAVENDPDLLEAWVELGKLWSVKQKDIAIHFFDNALRVDSTNVVALHEKALYQAQAIDDLNGSLETYRKLISLHPQYEPAYYDSGLLLLEKDSIAAAKQQFDLAIQINPTFVEAFYYRGLASEFMGDGPSAKNDYEQVLRMAPSYEAAKEGIERLNQ